MGEMNQERIQQLKDLAAEFKAVAEKMSSVKIHWGRFNPSVIARNFNTYAKFAQVAAQQLENNLFPEAIISLEDGLGVHAGNAKMRAGKFSLYKWQDKKEATAMTAYHQRVLDIMKMGR